MWWNKKEKLSERASYNCIDLTGYFHYPSDVVEQILIAMEEGCTRTQINQVLHKSDRREIISELINIQMVPDVNSFTQKLSESLKSVYRIDIRENIKSLELLIPDDKAHGWSSIKSHITLQEIQKHAEEEPEITILFLHFLVADCLISDTRIVEYSGELNRIIDTFVIDGIKKENACLLSSSCMELLAFYYAVSGTTPGHAIESCGRTAAALGFSPRRTYHFMLETAALLVMVQMGITAGCTFLENNKLPARYEIRQIGIRRKLHAVLYQEPPFLLETCTVICRHPESLSETLFSKNPDRITVLACQIFAEAVMHTQGLWKDITISKEVQQYVKEILSYCRKEVTKNAQNYK